MEENRGRFVADRQDFIVRNDFAIFACVRGYADDFVVIFVSNDNHVVAELRPFVRYLLIALDDGTSRIEKHYALTLQSLFELFGYAVGAYEGNVALFEIVRIRYIDANRAFF